MTNEALDALLVGPLGPGRPTVLFQPVARLSDGQIVSVEALGRWDGADGVVAEAAALFAAADACGVRAALSARLAALAVQAHAPLAAQGVALAVNASCLELADPAFAQALLSHAAAAQLDPHRLAVEITEDAALADPDAVRTTLTALRAQGVRVMVDDFGMAFANLGWLLALPLDGLKLDAAFTRAAAAGAAGRAIAARTAQLAQDLGLTATAEGVETAADRALMTELGYGFGQGRLFGMPQTGASALSAAQARPVVAPS